MCRQKRPAGTNGGRSSPNLILVNSTDPFSPNNHSSEKAFRKQRAPKKSEKGEENEEEKDEVTVLMISPISVQFGLVTLFVRENHTISNASISCDARRH
ncbi:hypothetical protein GQ55_9G478600 [Panicum hallii var. hallii]|uniref:Uncharacterized protein n=1 Tax=Panicum hallii var. hallii TaxID=1504633 RepID=A0A2T7CCQ2_9POAL|nr:hypothetical protein GQ55_9G478600 [Panicum hallii var. hallii]